MNQEAVNAAIGETIRRIQAEEIGWLADFYAKAPEELRLSEQRELAPRAIGFPITAQKALTEALRERDVPYVNTLWKKISESLPSLSYVYIDWDSVSGRSKYQAEISPEEFQRAKEEDSGSLEDWFFPVTVGVASGGVTSAVIALVNFIIPGSHFPILLPALVVGTTAAVGSAFARPIFTSENAERAPSGGADAGAPDASDVIEAARKSNQDAVKAWCRKLQEIAEKVCGEVKS